MSVKINSFELENVKRVKAVQLTPSENGLTIIGGRNGQGKTSVIDAIAWALGGDRFKPSNAVREGSVIPPHLKIELSNGIVVERSGDSSRLKVIDSSGNKGGQQLLNEFIEQLALDLPKFMQSTAKEKANILLNIIGVGDKVYELETEEKRLYNQRTTIGQIADQKEKYAKEMPVYSGLPSELLSPAELIKQQQNILAKNGENQRQRFRYDELVRRDAELKQKIAELQAEYNLVAENLANASKTVAELVDESTAELEENIRNIEEINAKIRANFERERAEIEAEGYKKQYEDLTEKIDSVRKEKISLLNGADLPLKGLSVEDGELTYRGKKWDGMSGSEQLKISTAIIRKLNPQCGFVLLDKLEQMDFETLKEFGKWLESEELQVIATRVSTGEECSVIIEDGAIKAEESKTWKAGAF